eukprot:TRINITY_DN8796_c0_g1_i1.p1 TRINITY_DN8796_c0_g1~~TRINITY_DN8796_c0_g1_i1.p1  ORF type:complete len:131 (+),score=22.62 TRINITY_DN8796_c0_g1_i1:26-418(+)
MSSAEEGSENAFPIVQWVEHFVEMPIFFHVMFMNQTIFAWVGSSEGELRHLHASIPTQQHWGGLPPATGLLGPQSADNPGATIAARIVKRTGHACFLSFNVPSSIPHLQEFVEKRLVDRITTHLKPQSPT